MVLNIREGLIETVGESGARKRMAGICLKGGNKNCPRVCLNHQNKKGISGGVLGFQTVPKTKISLNFIFWYIPVHFF
jgi:hypothetical protein